MDASYKIQRGIHVHLIQFFMCPEFWVHINRAGQLRSFLSYYLPTTLKILRAYARMEEQGVEGENIRSAKARIEGMMDKVVEGFEKQLDKLFQDDAMDIATDVQVLERMLEKDGLSGGGMTLGG